MKRAYEAMDCTENNTSDKVMLVERNKTPQGIALVNSNNVAKKSPNDLVQLAMEIEKADNYIKANACNKLQIIVEQMRFLQKQAGNVLLEAKENTTLHHAACNFVKKPGSVYHLYQRESGQLYFSMLSPEEWGNSGPIQIYKGSFKLEQDHSWTPLSKAASRERDLCVMNKILQANECLSLDSNNDMSVEL